ncbi:MAG: YncE family protein [Acidobacteriota bacterium]
MKKIVRLLLPIVFLQLAVCMASSVAQTSGYRVRGRIDIGGESRWDYCIVDTLHHRLFVSHGNLVHAVDLFKETVIGDIPGLNGVHGIALAYDQHKGYISNGRSDSVTVFDLTTLKVVRTIHVTGRNPDAIVYEPVSHSIFTFNGRSANATAIDAQTDAVAGTVPLDGKPEFAAADLKGNLFVNIEDKSLVEKIDARRLTVLNRWSIAPCEDPTGLALDVKNNRVFSVGSNKHMTVLDYVKGTVAAVVPIGGGPDGCVYDAEQRLLFSSNGEGSLTVIRQESADRYRVIETIATARGLRTLALDPVTHKLYLIGMIEGKEQRKRFGVLIVAQ